MKKRYFWRTFLILVCIAIIVLAGFVAQSYYRLEIQNFSSKDYAKHSYYIDSSTTIEQVLDMMEADYEIGSRRDFMLHAKLMHFHYPEPGFYTFDSIISNREVIRRFKIGEQTPVTISWNTFRKPEDLAGMITKTIRMDSVTFMNYMEDEDFLGKYGLNKENSRCLFLPNTYQVLWTITPEQLFDRMQVEYDKFWTPDRLEKAEQKGLSPIEVSILASIIERESQRDRDLDTIASLYLNRLDRGMLLQADPTVIYAVGDFTIERVLTRHLQYDSPYNTYKYKGLPPGPIRCPQPKNIDKILNAPKTNYIFMCAKIDGSGTHTFTTKLSDHNRAASEYRAMMDRRAAEKRQAQALAQAEEQAQSTTQENDDLGE